MLREIPKGSTSSMVKPLSAIIESRLEKGRYRKTLRSTISLFDMLLVYNCSINAKDPLGEIPTGPCVMWCDVYKN